MCLESDAGDDCNHSISVHFAPIRIQMTPNVHFTHIAGKSTEFSRIFFTNSTRFGDSGNGNGRRLTSWIR